MKSVALSFVSKPSEGADRSKCLIRALSLAAVGSVVLLCAGCGSPPEDPRCYVEPPEWYWEYQVWGIPPQGRAHYDGERGECRQPMHVSCADICFELSEEKCHQCYAELIAWKPFESIEECREVCE